MTTYRSSAILVSWLLMAGDAFAQCCCCCTVTCQTIYEPQPTTQYRLEYETEYEEREVVTRRPVWKTETRTRILQVATPKTVTRQRSFTVPRAVWETKDQGQQYVVREPVTETHVQDQTYTAYDPVTVMRTQYVDQGQYVNKVEQTPGRVRRRLRFRSRQPYVDAVTGQQKFQRAGLYWVPSQGRGTTRVNRVWMPNVVAQQVPETTYQARQAVRQVQVQRTNLVDKLVKPPPVQVLTWKNEVVNQSYQVTEVQYEPRTEDYEVRVCECVEVREKVQVPLRRVAKWIPVTVTRMVPRSVVMRVPVELRKADDDHKTQLSDDDWHSQVPQDIELANSSRSKQHSVLKQPTTNFPEITSFPAADRNDHANRLSRRR